MLVLVFVLGLWLWLWLWLWLGLGLGAGAGAGLGAGLEHRSDLLQVVRRRPGGHSERRHAVADLSKFVGGQYYVGQLYACSLTS